MSVVSPARLDAQLPAEESTPRRQPPEWLDRFIGSDPGLTRLRSALQAVVTIAAAMGAEWLFVHLTHALQIDTHGAVLPPAQAALIAAQHHGLLIIAIMLGAVVGMIASFAGSMFPTPRAQLITFLLMPVPMVGGLALGLALGDHRVLALGSLAVVLTVGTYCRRFGPRGFVGGMLVFMGDFFGYFLHGEVALSDIGWLTAEIGIGALVAIVAQFTLFYPGRRSALRRMTNSFAARSRRVSATALDVIDDPENRPRHIRRLRRLLVRLNETALMIDAQLGDPASVQPGTSPTVLHQSLFDAELALTNMARFAIRIVDLELPDEVRALVRKALSAVADRDFVQSEIAAHDLLATLRRCGPTTSNADHDADPAPDELSTTTHIVAHRFAVSVLGWVTAVQNVYAPAAPETEPFAPSVMLLGGWLPGAAMVSAAASMEVGTRRRDRIKLAPYSRVAIQMGIAVTAAIVFGDMLSGRRFYWAVIAAFVTFMGANNAGEQLRKGFFRVAGTVVGVVIGAVFAHLVGNRTGLAITVILVALFFGLYLMRISYAFMVIGITVMVSQLYVQLDEYTNSLLVLRLEETALGAGVAALTVLCVLPLRAGRVVRVAARQHVEALADVAREAVARMSGTGGDGQLRAAVRRLDGAYQTLVAAAAPLRNPLPGAAGGQREQLLLTASASRHYARNLITDTAFTTPLPAEARVEIERGAATLAGALAELTDALRDDNGGSGSTYTRSAALFDLAATHLGDADFTAPSQLALRDLQLLDGAMASLAERAGLSIVALDTTDQLAAEQS